MKNDRDNWQLDEPNPKFLKRFDFDATLPGTSLLTLDVYDYDDIFGDDLIGKTIIDLEDRYFNLNWLTLADKPIEYRQIYHDSSTVSQGVVKLWLEIIPSVKSSDCKEWDISEKPPEEFEVRVCIFNCKDVKIMDVEGTSDVYMRAFFDSKKDTQETDTHYRN